MSIRRSGRWEEALTLSRWARELWRGVITDSREVITASKEH
jgi:hypothetical protein